MIALKFIVVGGGISGLLIIILATLNTNFIWYGNLGIAAAYTLQKAGHHVLLIESSDGRSRVGAHFQLILRCHWILTIKIRRVKVVCGQFRRHSPCSVFHMIA